MAEHDGDPVPGDPGIAGLVPFRMDAGLGHLRQAVGATWESRDALPYAARVLSRAVCGDCALGPRGLQDDVSSGLHLCGKRLRGLRHDTIGPLAPVDVADIERLRAATDDALAGLGRIPYPFVRRAGGRGFTRASWDEALGLIGGIARDTAPERQAWLAGTERLTNEAYYAFGKAARLVGTAHLDFCAPPHVAGLAPHLGVNAATCSLSDVVGTDLLLLWRTDLPTEQPAALKSLHHAKQQGTRIVVLDTALDPGLTAAWIASIPGSAVFGSRLADDFVAVRPGGDRALLDAILAVLIAWGAVDHAFIEAHTAGWPACEASLRAADLPALLAEAGVRINEVEWLAKLIARSRSMVTLFGQRLASADVAGIAHLHLARGALGRPKCGVMPIPGASGLLGGADCGIRPGAGGMSARGALNAAHRGEIDVLYTMSGDLYRAALEPTTLVEAAARVRLRVHQAEALDPSVLLDPGELVVVLPAASRHQSGGTITSVERRIRFSPEIPGGRPVGEAKPAWRIPGLVAAVAKPELASSSWSGPQEVRAEIARTVPRYSGIDRLTREGDWLQWGGPQLFADGRFDGLPDARARFLL